MHWKQFFSLVSFTMLVAKLHDSIKTFTSLPSKIEEASSNDRIGSKSCSLLHLVCSFSSLQHCCAGKQDWTSKSHILVVVQLTKA